MAATIEIAVAWINPSGLKGLLGVSYEGIGLFGAGLALGLILIIGSPVGAIPSGDKPTTNERASSDSRIR